LFNQRRTGETECEETEGQTMTIELVIPITAMLDAIPSDLKIAFIFCFVGIICIIPFLNDLLGSPFGIFGVLIFGVGVLFLMHFIMLNISASVPPAILASIPNMTQNTVFPISVKVI
jgi:uncharacterized membrane protein